MSSEIETTNSVYRAGAREFGLWSAGTVVSNGRIMPRRNESYLKIAGA